MNKEEHQYKRDEVMEIINSVVAKLQEQPKYSLKKAKQDLLEVVSVIHSARGELAALHSTSEKGDIQTATDELDAIIGATEQASGTIMDACEGIQELLDGVSEPQRSKIQDKVTEIFEACSFQDITGQRITKVVKVVKTIEAKIEEFLGDTSLLAGQGAVKKDISEWSDEELKNGPQLQGEGVSQEEIDKLLADF